jgi:hypothetical protein
MKKLRDILEQQKTIIDPSMKREVEAESQRKSFVNKVKGFFGIDSAPETTAKIQDRVPQEIPRSPMDKAPERKDSVALQRQMSGDKPPAAQSMQDKLNMMRLKGDVEHEAFKKKMDSDFKAAQQAAANKKLAPQESQRAPVDKTKPEPKVGSLVAPQAGYPAAEKTKAPIPKAKPEQNMKVISKGDTLWDIAGGDPKEVKRLRQLNPKLNPSKMPIGYQLKLK